MPSSLATTRLTSRRIIPHADGTVNFKSRGPGRFLHSSIAFSRKKSFSQWPANKWTDAPL